MDKARIAPTSKRHHPSFVRRGALLIALAGFAGLVFALFADLGSEAQTLRKRAVESAEAPKAIGPYSQGIIANGFVYTAGQIGTDPKTGALVEGGIVEQTTQALKNIEAVLKASGSAMDDVVKTTVFLSDMNDFAKMNEVYATRFRQPYPARSTVQVARLPRDAKIEIETVAVVAK
jgi:2-iminobutanoate/2-iminopropanoate deaminase